MASRSGSSDEDNVIRSRDNRRFTDDEYRRELTLHHVKIDKGRSPVSVYNDQDESVRGRPKSGVFRDFAEYGVHPAVVVLMRVRLTVPFVTTLLSAVQVSEEISNLKKRDPETKKKDTKWPEEEEAELGSRPTLTLGGEIFSVPSVEAAYMLIKTLSEHPGEEDYLWRPAMQLVMSALNFYLFRYGDPKDIPSQELTPPRDRAAFELIPIIPKKIIVDEMNKRALMDPDNRGVSGTRKESEVTMADMVDLVGDVMTQAVYSSQMREIVNWYKIVYQRLVIVRMIQKVIKKQETMITTLRARMLAPQASRRSKDTFWE